MLVNSNVCVEECKADTKQYVHILIDFAFDKILKIQQMTCI